MFWLGLIAGIFLGGAIGAVMMGVVAMGRLEEER